MKKRGPAAYIFVSPVHFLVTGEVAKILPSPPQYLHLHPKSVLDALSAFDECARGVIVVSARDAKHLKIATTLAERLKDPLQRGLVKIVLITALDHPELPKYLKKHGCEEPIHSSTKAKGLKLKLARLMSLVELAWEKSGRGRHLEAADEADELLKAGPKKPGTAVDTKPKPQVKAVAPLKITDDCWIIRGRAFKFVQDMWIVQVQGPSPNTGRWLKAGERLGAWIWVPRDPSGNPFVTEGAWTFYGRQPENKDRQWTFVGAEPRLTYSQDGKDVCHRFEGNAQRQLRVARNSRSALRKSAQIAATYEADLKVRKAAAPAGAAADPFKPVKPSKAAPDLGGLSLDYGKEEAIGGDVIHEDLAIGPPAPPFADGRFGDKTVLEVERLRFYEELLDELGPRAEMFQAVSRRKDCLALMRESAHVHAPAILWTRGQKFRRDTQISHFTKESASLSIRLPDKLDWSKFLGALQSVQAQEIFVNANLGRTAIFFRQPLSEMREGKTAVEVSCPERIYEVQRRRDFRHHLKPGENNQATLVLTDGVQAVWKLLDISAGGACVAREDTPLAVAGQLVRGARVASVSFKIYGQEVECAARVAWVRRAKGKGSAQNIRMGLQFEHITHADREGIRLYVMEENYQYLKNDMARINPEE